MRRIIAAALLATTTAALAEGQLSDRSKAVLAPLPTLYPEIEALYTDLHQSPELSLHEEKTSAKMAARLRAAGFEVTEKVGGWGVVGVLKNGTGPAILVRTDLDGLPVEEKTGLPYASKATARDDEGKTVPVMHACGHDIHMSEWVATATLLSRTRDAWHGTLIFIGQPAEEKGAGAAAMLEDKLYERFGKPDLAIAFHDDANIPSGTIGWVSGFCYANVDSVDITFYGKGGHGAYPHLTVDPIVIGARFVTTVQTLVARENNPFDPGVITVGSFHAGSKHNIISDQAKLQLTVRSYKEDVRKKLLSGIERIAKAEAAAAGAPKEPEVRHSEATPATYNDPALTQRLVTALSAQLGKDKLIEMPPTMGGEDFSRFGRSGVPSCMLTVGAVNPERYTASKASGEPLPSLHSPLFAPDREPTLKTGITALTICVLEALGKP
ncbi:MAG TPA: amidohydrolase [Candidatus Limnocylindria bacterium]|jgi:hippurate hydrolase|nr:amidohydrolase [Candidatus Limnocylindria bacterium]